MKRNLTWRFPITLDDGQVRTWVDLLLFDQLVRHIIDQHRSKVDHWRIHRRWESGKHEFEFWCYGEDCLGDQTLRNSLNSYIEEDETVKALKSACYATVHPPEECGLSAADEPLPICHKNLHQALQRCYPKFIQRPCETLRDVIENLCCKAGPRPRIRDGMTLPDIEQYYRGIESKVQDLWLNGAAYAYFHFFHMVFGYMPFDARLCIDPGPAWQTVQLERFDGHVRRADQAQCRVLDIR